MFLTFVVVIFFTTNLFSQYLGDSPSSSSTELWHGGNLALSTVTGAKSRIHLHHPYPDGITPVALPIFVQFTNKHTTDGASNGFKVGISLLTQKDAYLDQQEDANMYFLTNKQTQVTITNIGRVGVGITAPNYTMHLHSLDEVPGGSKPPGGFSSIGIDPSVVSPASTRGVNMQGYNALQITNTTTDLQPTDGLLIGTIGNASFINQQENADLDFYTHNIKRLVITKYGVFKFNTISENAQVNIQSQTKNGMFIRALNPNINYGLAIVSNNNVNAILVNNKNNFIVKGDGRVGIGEANPNRKLVISTDNSTLQLKLQRTGSSAGITEIGTDNSGFYIYAGGYANNKVFKINHNGDVGIGTDDTHGYKLAIKGYVIAEDFSIAKYQDWPDYVFINNYTLLPLQDLEIYIKNKKHLPDMPSAIDVKQNGIKIGEMNALLLKKIEELTLYIIQQQKQIDILKEKIN